MSDIKDNIIRKLSEQYEDSLKTPRFGWDNPRYEELHSVSRDVMSAYQDANKWLDTIKEHVLINLHLPYFSHIVHELAHTMPGRFDAFGDILHTENLMIPYPTTTEWDKPIGDVKNTINVIYDILDHIKDALLAFRKIADSVCPAMVIPCDSLIADISGEYKFFIEIESQLEYYGTKLPLWDHNVFAYWNNKSSLI